MISKNLGYSGYAGGGSLAQDVENAVSLPEMSPVIALLGENTGQVREELKRRTYLHGIISEGFFKNFLKKLSTSGWQFRKTRNRRGNRLQNYAAKQGYKKGESNEHY